MVKTGGGWTKGRIAHPGNKVPLMYVSKPRCFAGETSTGFYNYIRYGRMVKVTKNAEDG